MLKLNTGQCIAADGIF